MKFDELDRKMRVFETSNDHCVLPGLHIVARLDGRSFTRLTREVCRFEAPFDVRFRDLMVETVRHLMETGFRVRYGYTQSDEISLLFHRDEDSFGRKSRKINSVLAGEASAKFSLLLGRVACFDCRVCELPTPELVVDYFRWRNEDAHRNALNAHCYWALRHDGAGAGAAAAKLAGLSVADKNELLFRHGTNFNTVPEWQRRGIGVCWREVTMPGRDPRTGRDTTTLRRELHPDFELPMKDEYSAFIARILETGAA